MAENQTLILKDALLADGRLVDLEIQDGKIARHHKPGAKEGTSGSSSTSAKPSSKAPYKTDSLNKMLVLPALAEPHAHLDKALSASQIQNPSGDLMGAVRAWIKERNQISHEDYVKRATTAVELALTNGATAIRTHIDVGSDIPARGVLAAAEVKNKLAHLIQIQIVALATSPLTGADGRQNREALELAMQSGADLVGGVPALDPDPSGCIDFCLDLAADLKCGVDLHIDETLDPEVLTVKSFCQKTSDIGFEHGATASHCVSLGMQDLARQKAIAEKISESQVSVVTLPQTNLYLQARGIFQSQPRGLTALAALEEAGVLVAAGGDNLQDPFNLMGRADPLETASLLVTAGHLSPECAFAKVANDAREVMGLSPAGTEIGQTADLMCIEAGDLREAVALAPALRRTYKAGELVATAAESRKIVE